VRTEFHPLRVNAIERLTDDSAAITFDVPADLARTFTFAPGQSLTIRMGEERRSYSICAPAGRAPRIGIREVEGGAVSGTLVHRIKVGDRLEVQAPSGKFTPDLTHPASHVLIAAGSGITPMLSIASSVLAADDKSTVCLLYGNRRADTVMFADELADLKDRYPSRMQLVHVLSREAQEVELFTGRLDGEKLRRLVPVCVDVDSVDHWWLCGPFEMVNEAIGVLSHLGVERRRIHRELFWVGDEPPVEATHEEVPIGDGATVTIILDGRSSAITLPPGTTILDGAQKMRPDLPFSCKGGVCGTCRAKITGGTGAMRRNYALEPDEVEAGYVLTCQTVPTSDEITVDYDA
jgi:ring-1,2-phenylacetyl-CoA epoxidase subunit PaaE